MKPEQQKIAIARACGEDNDSIVRGLIPDYLNDLNAMHKVCETLTEQQEMAFRDQLHAITRRDYESGVRSRILSTINATAAQRAEAFLITLNLWKEKQ